MEDIEHTMDFTNASDAISIHDGVSPGEPRARRFGAKCSADRVTALYCRGSLFTPLGVIKILELKDTQQKEVKYF